MIHKIILPTPFAVGDVNAYLMKGDSLTLVDAGTNTEEALFALRKGIEAAGYKMEEVEQVILTHHHPDHAGLIDYFPNAKLFGHSYNQVWLEKEEAFFQYHDDFYTKCLLEEGVPTEYLKWVKMMRRPIHLIGNRKLDSFLMENDNVPGLHGYKVIETLGHAQSHISLWNEKEGILIGGDHILAKISSNPLIEPPLPIGSPRPKSMLQYNASLKKVQLLDVQKVYAGHGEEVEEVSSLIAYRLERQRERALKVLEMVKEGKKTVYQLTQQLFPKVYEKELGLTLSETIGQLDYLIDEQLIREQRDERGILYYEVC